MSELKRINLLDESAFEPGSGLWTGKKGPFVTATVIRNTNFTASGRVDYSDVAVLQVEEKQFATRRLQAGDIIIERSGGGPTQPVGRVVFFERVDGVFSHSNFTTRLRVIDTSKLDRRFVFYFLLYFHDSGQTDHLQRRTTGIRNLDWRAYRETAEVPLFEIGEQRQIALVLSSVQRAIERQERLIALTAELKKALMQKLFTEGTRGEPLKQTEIGRMPKSWEPTALGTCCDILNSSMSYTDFGRATVAAEADAVQCMAVKVSDMNLDGNEAAFVTANLMKPLPAAIATRKLVPAQSVVFPKRGAAIATNKKRQTTTWTALDPNLIAVRAKESVDPQFLFYWSQTFDLRTITDPGPTPQLNKKDLTPLKIPLPPTHDEQRLIAAALDSVNAKMVSHRRAKVTLNSLFRTLLHQLMTAQVRVYDLDLPVLDDAAAETIEAAGAPAGVTSNEEID